MEGVDASSSKAPKAVLRTIKPGKLFTKYEKLDDWVKLLQDFKTVQKRSKPSKGFSTSQNVHVVLSKWVVRATQAGRLSAIEANFFGAAMHLSYLLHNPFPENQLPELCSNLNALSSVRLTETTHDAEEWTATEYTREEVQFWQGVFSGEDSKRERLPLQMALLVSPICLLMPIQIFKNKFGKESVVQTSIALGNQRPPALVAVERILWAVLFDTATGDQDPESALAKLVASLPWDVVQTCSTQDRAWFQLSTSIDKPPQATSSTASVPSNSNSSDIAQPITQSEPSSIACINSADVHPDLSAGDPLEGPPKVTSVAVQFGLNPSFLLVGAAEGMLPEQSNEDDEPLHSDSTSNVHSYASELLQSTLSLVHPPQSAPTSTPVIEGLAIADGSQRPESCSDKTGKASTQLEVALEKPRSCSVVNEARANTNDNPGESLSFGPRKCPPTRGIEDGTMGADRGKGGLSGDSVLGRGPIAGVEEGEEDVEEEEEEGEEEGGDGDGDGEKKKQRDTSSFSYPSHSAAAVVSPPIVRPNGYPARRSSRQKPDPTSTPTTTPLLSFPRSKPVKKRKRSDTLTDEKLHDGAEKAQRTESGRRRPPMDEQEQGHTGEGTRDDPIRIDVKAYSLFETGKDTFEHVETNLRPLCPVRQSQRVSPKSPLKLWDAELKMHPILPRFHHEHELVKFVRIMDGVSDNYVNGFPRHVAKPSSSLFRTIDHSDYKKLKVGDLNEILRNQCIVVSNMPWAKVGFDSDGLETLTDLDAVVSIQDLSLSPRNDGSDRIQNGTLQQMLQSSSSGPRSKALNALSFPFVTADEERSCFDKNPHATCRVAWKKTSGTIFEREDRMPLSDVHWGLAATAGAMTWWHLDSDGFGTTVDVHAGSKVWIVGSDEEERFSSLGLLLTEHFEIDLPPKGFRTEAVLLTPGTRLIMRPGVVHAVFTPSDSVCHGSHFYSTPTMQATLVSLIHGFVCHRYITNISHPLTRVFLRRTLHFYHRGLVLNAAFSESDRAHLPRLAGLPTAHVEINEALNLLSVCYMVLCINVLDPRSYTAPGQAKDALLTVQQRVVMNDFDVNAVPFDEREDVCMGRGACLEVLAWFRKCFLVTVKDNGITVDLPSILFFQISRCLLRYKYAAEVNRIQAAGHSELHLMIRQLEASLALDKETWEMWSSQEKDFWMDDEMHDNEMVEVPERADEMREATSAGPVPASCGEEGEVEDVSMDLEEREIDARADRRIDVGREPHSFPDLAMDEAKWRLDSLLLENKSSYLIVRRDVQFQSPKLDHNRWRTVGRTSLDEAFFTAASIRKTCEAVGMHRHIISKVKKELE